MAGNCLERGNPRLLTPVRHLPRHRLPGVIWGQAGSSHELGHERGRAATKHLTAPTSGQPCVCHLQPWSAGSVDCCISTFGILAPCSLFNIFIWPCRALVAARGTSELHCGMWALRCSMWDFMDPGAPALGARSLTGLYCLPSVGEERLKTVFRLGGGRVWGHSIWKVFVWG